jgi:hypothetical protein
MAVSPNNIKRQAVVMETKCGLFEDKENIRGLTLAVVKLTIVQVTKLPLPL